MAIEIKKEKKMVNRPAYTEGCLMATDFEEVEIEVDEDPHETVWRVLVEKIDALEEKVRQSYRDNSSNDCLMTFLLNLGLGCFEYKVDDLRDKAEEYFFNVIDEDLYRAVVLSLEDEYGIELNQANQLEALIESEKLTEKRKKR